ncbi:hypothetical protein [Streptomyces sp. NPDC051554]
MSFSGRPMPRMVTSVCWTCKLDVDFTPLRGDELATEGFSQAA